MSVANEAWRLENLVDFEFRSDLAKVGAFTIATYAERWCGWRSGGGTRRMTTFRGSCSTGCLITIVKLPLVCTVGGASRFRSFSRIDRITERGGAAI